MFESTTFSVEFPSRATSKLGRTYGPFTSSSRNVNIAPYARPLRYDSSRIRAAYIVTATIVYSSLQKTSPVSIDLCQGPPPSAINLIPSFKHILPAKMGRTLTYSKTKVPNSTINRYDSRGKRTNPPLNSPQPNP